MFEKYVKAFKKVTELENKRDKLKADIKAAKDEATVRALGETLETVLEELQAAKDALAQAEQEAENQTKEPASGDEERGGNPFKEFTKRANYQTTKEPKSKDPSDTEEYRHAFMEYVCRGTAIPSHLRDDSLTVTTDAGAVIPTTIVNEIVKKMESYGEIYNRVRHLNVQGGIEFPILDLKPTANWIDETTHNDDQKLQSTQKVSFSYYGLECKIAQSLLTNIVTIDAFQKEFTTLATEAIVKALEIAIISGDGEGKALGITKDPRVTKVVTLSPSEFTSWSAWKKKVFAQIPKAYRKGSFLMAQGTFDGYIDGMVDQNGQPVGRVNYGISESEVYRFGGKEVMTVEEEAIPGYDTASDNDVVAAFVNLKDYGVNSNMQMQVVKWTDHDKNKVKNKAIVICDGKLIDPNGVVLIKKGAAMEMASAMFNQPAALTNQETTPTAASTETAPAENKSDKK